MPNVLANSEPELDTLKRHHAGTITGAEVALLVEHLIIRQALLVVLRTTLPSCITPAVLNSWPLYPWDNRSPPLIQEDKTPPRPATRVQCESTDLREAINPQGIAGKRQLRKHDQPCTSGRLSETHVNHALGIGGDITTRVLICAMQIFMLSSSRRGCPDKNPEAKVPYFAAPESSGITPCSPRCRLRESASTIKR